MIFSLSKSLWVTLGFIILVLAILKKFLYKTGEDGEFITLMKDLIFYIPCLITDSIEFIKNPKKLNKKILIIHTIYIKIEYRNQGYCKNFIKYLIDKSDDKTCIIIQSVLSKILYDFLLRFEYNNQKFLLKKEGFIWYK